MLARALLVLAALASPALAEPVSPWARDGSAALRLVDAGQGAAPGERLAAIEITLEPGWKTYWRQPGASGVPPRFDFSASSNLAEARIAYPTPERSAGEDGVTNVYHGAVTLPVAVRPRDPAAPVELRLVADYGVCEAVCVPIRAEAEIDLEPGGGAAGPAADEARRAVETAPRPMTLAETGPLDIVSVRRAPGPGQALEVVAATPPGSAAPELFAETGEGDFAPAPEMVGEVRDGRAQFRIAFDEPELPRSGLRLTLAAGGRAVETAVALDAIEPAR